jgi:hypothetical protein
MAGDGVLKMFVWPTYAGVLDINTHEPQHDPEYQRAPIHWELVDGIMLGRTNIPVPEGEWPYVIYAHSPHGAGFLSFQALSHPLVFKGTGGVLDLRGITEHDVRPKELSRNGNRSFV